MFGEFGASYLRKLSPSVWLIRRSRGKTVGGRGDGQVEGRMEKEEERKGEGEYAVD